MKEKIKKLPKSKVYILAIITVLLTSTLVFTAAYLVGVTINEAKLELNVSLGDTHQLIFEDGDKLEIAATTSNF